MKRDKDLIRDILITRESKKDIYDLDHPEEKINYHVWLLNNGGFIDAIPIEDRWCITSLSWQGVELLELIRDHHIWEEIRQITNDFDCNFGIIKIIATRLLNKTNVAI